MDDPADIRAPQSSSATAVSNKSKSVPKGAIRVVI
jgi:hypothetical protein